MSKSEGENSSSCVVISSAYPDGFTGTGYAARSILPVLSQRFSRIDYVVVPAAEASEPESDSLPGSIVFHRVNADTSPKWKRFLKSLISRWPGSVQRYTNPEFCGTLKDVLKRGDKAPEIVVVLDSPLYWPFLESKELRSKARNLVLWSQNVISDAFTGLLRGESFPKALAWKWEISRLEAFENAALHDADHVWSITEDDQKEFEKRFSISAEAVVGIRLDEGRFAMPIGGDTNTLLYLGSFDVRKRQGIEVFVREVFPKLREKFPDLRLILGGKGSENFDEASPGVEARGFVDDEAAFMAEGLVVVNPQDSGSGIKLKSLHALAAGKVLLTTPVGVQGIPAVSGRDCLLAEEVCEMGEVIEPLLSEPEALLKIAENARAWMRNTASPDRYDAHLEAVIETVL